MKPKWQKLASLAYAHSSFSSLVQSLLPKDTLLRTIGPNDALYQNYTIGLALPLRDFIQACT